MLRVKQFKNLEKLEKSLKLLKEDNYYFLGEFLREVDHEYDELIIVLEKKGKELILTCKHINIDKLPKISDIFYAAHTFENEIYDFYGKEINSEHNYILRLHSFAKDYFPMRKLGKPSIKEKNNYSFTNMNFEGVTKVQVGPIHAGIISPAHFRFTVDGEDMLNLDIQLGWKYRGIEDLFTQKKKLNELLSISEEIVGDSVVSNTISFVKVIEKSADIKITKQTKLNRVILLELERIYNHLWTMGAMLNDIGQGYLLNGFLEVREEFLKLNKKVFGSRLLSGVVNFGQNNLYINKKNANKILKTLKNIEERLKNLENISTSSAGIYDRLYTAGILKKTTAFNYSALGVVGKASGINRDYRVYDKMYKDIDVIIYTKDNGDAYDRFNIRLDEVGDSFRIIKESILNLDTIGFENKTKKNNFDLQDGYFIGRTEGHRGENLMLVYIENGRIKYFKFRDPSFLNWVLLEYACLNNIIADFPVCNKSFDLSYSGFDV